MHLDQHGKRVEIKIAIVGPDSEENVRVLRRLEATVLSQAFSRSEALRAKRVQERVDTGALEVSFEKEIGLPMMPRTRLEMRLAEGQTFGFSFITTRSGAEHRASLQLLLSNADALIFVADAANSAAEQNVSTWTQIFTLIDEDERTDERLPTHILYLTREGRDERLSEDCVGLQKIPCIDINFLAATLPVPELVESCCRVLSNVFRELCRRRKIDRDLDCSVTLFDRNVDRMLMGGGASSIENLIENEALHRSPQDMGCLP